MNNSNQRNEFFWLLLVVASFLLGHLITKTQYLEQKQVAGATTEVVNQLAAPTLVPVPPAGELPSADKVPKVTAADRLRGKTNAPITLVEYSDLECPFCKRFHPTMQKILSDYKGQVSWVYRHFPLPFHPQANPAALAAECAAEQGGNELFWEYVDGIFAESTLTAETVVVVAEKVGLEKTKFETCFQAKKYQKVIDDQLAGGQQAGINGTPGTILINNQTGKTQLISGALPYEEIKKTIDAAL